MLRRVALQRHGPFLAQLLQGTPEGGSIKRPSSLVVVKSGVCMVKFGMSTWFVRVALVVAMLGAGLAQAAVVITLTASGVITAGTDSSGALTGVAAADLAGRTATVTHRFEVTPLVDLSSANDPNGAFAFFETIFFGLAIDGTSVASVDSAIASAALGLYQVATLDIGLGRDALIDSQLTVIGSDDSMLLATAQLTSALTSLVPASTLFQDFSFAGVPSQSQMTFGASFELADGNGGTLAGWDFFVQRAGSLVVQVTRTGTVSEPQTLWLVAACLLALALLRQRVHRVQRGTASRDTR